MPEYFLPVGIIVLFLAVQLCAPVVRFSRKHRGRKEIDLPASDAPGDHVGGSLGVVAQFRVGELFDLRGESSVPEFDQRWLTTVRPLQAVSFVRDAIYEAVVHPQIAVFFVGDTIRSIIRQAKNTKTCVHEATLSGKLASSALIMSRSTTGLAS